MLKLSIYNAVQKRCARLSVIRPITVKAIAPVCFARYAEASDSKPAVEPSPGADWSPDQPARSRKLVPKHLTRIGPGSNPRKYPLSQVISRKPNYAYLFPPGN